MITNVLAQPETQLGERFEELLRAERPFSKIVFVSAFTALKTILRLRDRLLSMANSGTSLRLILGIDLGGTSSDVLEELLHWNCEVFLYHNPIPRATFHPKIYLFERKTCATLFLGSNNLTDGGLYTNYEACTCHDFCFPDDNDDYHNLLRPIDPFLNPSGATVQRLDAELIAILVARGVLSSEQEARRSMRARQTQDAHIASDAPASPFLPVPVRRAPLLPREIRANSLPQHHIDVPQEIIYPISSPTPPNCILVWKKQLTASDALHVRPGSHHVGGVRLTQAKFHDPNNLRIDQTKYFRSLFDDYDWEPELRGHSDQEHTFIPMRIVIRGTDYGIRNFEISHKPSGEAGQKNYTTQLRWGPTFNGLIIRENVSGAMLSLYETPDSDAQFLILIEDR